MGLNSDESRISTQKDPMIGSEGCGACCKGGVSERLALMIETTEGFGPPNVEV